MVDYGIMEADFNACMKRKENLPKDLENLIIAYEESIDLTPKVKVKQNHYVISLSQGILHQCLFWPLFGFICLLRSLSLFPCLIKVR